MATDDEEEAQNRERSEHRRRSRMVEERGSGEVEPQSRCDEQEVRDDPRTVVTRQHFGIRQPCHAFLVLGW